MTVAANLAMFSQICGLMPAMGFIKLVKIQRIKLLMPKPITLTIKNFPNSAATFLERLLKVHDLFQK